MKIKQMQFAINIPNLDIYVDARQVAELAHEAEESGWDGFFIWDHIGANWPSAVADPWMQLAAIAMATKRIKIGPLVTPLPRRRPRNSVQALLLSLLAQADIQRVQISKEI